MALSIFFANAFQILIFILSFYFIIKKPRRIERKIKKHLFILLFIQFIGIVFAIFNSIEAPPLYFINDTMVLLNFSLAPFAAISASYLLAKKQKINNLVINTLILVAIFIGFTKVFSIEYSFLGSFLRYNSTAVNYAIIYIAFFGITLILEKNSKKGYILVVIGIATGLMNLAKWSLPGAIILLALLYYFSYRNKTKYVFISSLLLFLLIAFFINGGLDSIAKNNGFDSFQSFIYERVILDSNEKEIGTTGYYSFLRDGGRFLMWQDIIERTMESPYTGIGVGHRAISDDGPNTHNILVFLLGNFGIPISIIFWLRLIIFFRLVYKNLPIQTDKRIRWAYLGWLTYLGFSFNVGASFDQSFNIFFAFFPLGYFVKSCVIYDQNKHSIKNKEPLTTFQPL